MRALLAICLAGCGATLADPGAEGAGSDRDVSGSCKQVDVLFAVDNSGSTPKEQQALRDAFPSFAAELLRVSDSYRIGLVDGCAQSAVLHTRGMSGPCNFGGGRAWVESSSPSAVDEFRCVAEIDSDDDECRGNNDEQPVTTAATALDPMWAGSSGPNAGFSRSDAVLVVIAITDEDERPVPALTAQALHDRLVATKSDASKVGFVGFGGESECEGPYGSAQDADMLQAVTASFGANGAFSNLCDGKLDEGLRAAVDIIAAACP